MIAFTDIVGMAQARQALLLLAVDPQLGGAVIPAPVGSGKSTLARAFAEVLPERTPFVELPLNVTEDRLLGGVDLEATLASGRRVVQRGVLARAHGGVLYVDSLSLLDSAAVAHVMDALSRGEVLVEREGLSEVHPARFMLLGTYDPTDGEVRMSLLDRIGLIVPLAAEGDSALREQVVRCVRSSESVGDAQTAAARDEALGLLRDLLAQARARLPMVQISTAQIQTLIRAALAFDVEGNRADGFAVRAALASAALKQRNEVDKEDLQTAVRLVLMPRATRQPEPEELEELLPDPPAQPSPPQADATASEEELEAAPEESESEPATPEPEPDTNPAEPPDEESSPAAPEETGFDEILLEAEATPMPEDILQVSLATGKRSRAGSRGEALNDRRGRFVRAQPGSLRSGKVALIPTLLAAAPWQASRRAEAARQQTGATPRALEIRRDDVRVKRFRDKSGTLFVFMVDASGSMALNRMRQAKGAVASLLQNAYVNRDQVALIAFRGQSAEVLLPPSQSVDRAKRELDVLPTGGGTPLASALYSGLQLAAQVRSRGIHQIHFVLITDGRANVGLQAALVGTARADHMEVATAPPRKALDEEVKYLAQAVAADGISATVIDTQMRHLSRGEAERLAGQLGGRYFYLPNARAEQIAQAVTA